MPGENVLYTPVMIRPGPHKYNAGFSNYFLRKLERISFFKRASEEMIRIVANASPPLTGSKSVFPIPST